METQALQEDRAQEQLQKDNQELLQKIHVSGVNVSVPKLGPITTRTLEKMKHSACSGLGPRNNLRGRHVKTSLPFYDLPRRVAKEKF